MMTNQPTLLTQTNDELPQLHRGVGEIPTLKRNLEGEDTAKVQGYAAVYDVWILRAEYNGFQYREMDQSGLFDQSLSTDPRVALRLNHKGAFASTWSNTLTLKSDEHGLAFEATLDTSHPGHLALAKDLETGLLREASVAYWVEDFDVTQRKDGEDFVVTRGDLDKGDVSVCLFGMNPAAWSSLKRHLDTDAGRQVLRSLGYQELVAESLDVAPTADTTELVAEVLDATDQVEPGNPVWDLRANLRLLQVESGLGVKELVG